MHFCCWSWPSLSSFLSSTLAVVAPIYRWHRPLLWPSPSSTWAIIAAISISDVDHHCSLFFINVGHRCGHFRCRPWPSSRASPSSTSAIAVTVTIVNVGQCHGRFCCWHWPSPRPSPSLESAIVTAVTIINLGHHCGRFCCGHRPSLRPSPSSTWAIVAAVAFVGVDAGTCNLIVVLDALCT